MADPNCSNVCTWGGGFQNTFFSVKLSKYPSHHPAELRQPDVEMEQFRQLLKTFLSERDCSLFIGALEAYLLTCVCVILIADV